MSKSERRLWAVIRKRSLDGSWRFRRQYPVGPYVLDFYCPSLRLAVEVDGTFHAMRRDRDELRDEFLATRGVKTARFESVDIIRNLSGVYTRLQSICRARASELGRRCGQRQRRAKHIDS